MTKSIEFYFDFSSPYSYIGYKEIKLLEKKNKFKIKYMPIFLGGLHNSAYIFIAYQIYFTENIFEVFNLYIGLEELYSLFSNEAFLLIFWLHFLAVNLFVGNWISSDSQIYLIPRFFVIISLISTYFAGPLGLTLYWVIRIFYSKKINYYD